MLIFVAIGFIFGTVAVVPADVVVAEPDVPVAPAAAGEPEAGFVGGFGVGVVVCGLPCVCTAFVVGCGCVGCECGAGGFAEAIDATTARPSVKTKVRMPFPPPKCRATGMPR